MEQTAFNAGDYVQRQITNYYLGKDKPVVIFTPPITTRRDFLEANPNILRDLETVFENARQAALKDDELELGRHIDSLQKLGMKYGLRGIDDLERELIIYGKEKPLGILQYYGLKE